MHERFQVVVGVAPQSSSWCRVEVGRGDDNQPDAVGWDEFLAAGVIERTLQAAMHSADGQPVRLVKVSPGQVVLSLAVLDDNVGVGPVAVDGQPDTLPT